MMMLSEPQSRFEADVLTTGLMQKLPGLQQRKARSLVPRGTIPRSVPGFTCGKEHSLPKPAPIDRTVLSLLPAT
jgi:hypothetical protein